MEDIFENFCNKCIETHMKLILLTFNQHQDLYDKCFLKKSGEELELLADTDMLQMVEKGNHR